MKSKSLIASFFVSALFLFVIQVVAQQPEHSPNPDMMGQHQGTMTGMGPGMAGMGHDSATMAEMSAMHELIVNHDRIKRSVTNLPNGIRTVTESDDPQIAKLIKDHVASMDQRVSAKSDPGLPIESPALHSILRDGDKVLTTTETTEKGTVVIQTSADPEIVVALQQHALEVSDLVKDGMAAVHSAMMKNGGGMMQGGMPGRMMGRTPNGEPVSPEQQSAVPPQGQVLAAQGHDQHHADVNKRGDQVMGFDQEKTTHHFYLYSDGGAIDVAVNDVTDKTNLDAIRAHLPHIAMMFSQGNFDAPMLVHDTKVSGTAEMGKLKERITYKYAETPNGGRVNIITIDAEALVAVHAFLKFQISDHKTGDSLEVRKR
jgi:hypothetical protein